MTVADRIRRGDLPASLEDADWRRYRSIRPLGSDWDSWCRVWTGIAWVRYQAFERDAEAEAAAEEWSRE